MSKERYPKVYCDNEDCISRRAVHEAITRWAGSMAVLVALPTREVRPLLDSIHELPSVTPKQRTGHWIECEDEVKCFCSECKEISDYPTKFCQNCGAIMVEPQERSEE